MVFLFTIVGIIFITIIFIFSKIQIEVNNFRFQSTSKRHINKDYEVIIKLFILKVIPIFKINITKTKLEKLQLKDKIKNIDFKLIQDNKEFDKKALKAVKELNVAIKNIDLYIDLGTENASLTSIIVPALSTIIAIILHRKIKKFENQVFVINPIYINQNLVNIYISGIFEIKMSHIINMIYVLNKEKKKGVEKNERSTSNRRTYGYSYE